MHIVKHSASWCGPCKMLKSMLETVNVGIEIQENDIDVNQEMAQKHRVRGVPTMVAFEGDREIGRKVGMMTKEQFTVWVDSLKQPK